MTVNFSRTRSSRFVCPAIWKVRGMYGFRMRSSRSGSPSSVAYPTAANLPESTFQEIRKALFAVNAETVAAVDGEVLKVLKSALADGFVPLEEQEFDTVRAMARRCNLPPYEKY